MEISSLFVYDRIGLEIMFDDPLVQKAFLDYKNIHFT